MVGFAMDGHNDCNVHASLIAFHCNTPDIHGYLYPLSGVAQVERTAQARGCSARFRII